MREEILQIVIDAARKSGGSHELTISQDGKNQMVKVGPYIVFDTFIAELEAALKNDEKWEKEIRRLEQERIIGIVEKMRVEAWPTSTSLDKRNLDAAIDFLLDELKKGA